MTMPGEYERRRLEEIEAALRASCSADIPTPAHGSLGVVAHLLARRRRRRIHRLADPDSHHARAAASPHIHHLERSKVPNAVTGNQRRLAASADVDAVLGLRSFRTASSPSKMDGSLRDWRVDPAGKSSYTYPA